MACVVAAAGTPWSWLLTEERKEGWSIYSLGIASKEVTALFVGSKIDELGLLWIVCSAQTICNSYIEDIRMDFRVITTKSSYIRVDSNLPDAQRQTSIWHVPWVAFLEVIEQFLASVVYHHCVCAIMVWDNFYHNMVELTLKNITGNQWIFFLFICSLL